MFFLFTAAFAAETAVKLPEYEVIMEASQPQEIRVGDKVLFKVKGSGLSQHELAEDKDLIQQGLQFIAVKEKSEELAFYLVPLKSGQLSVPAFEIKNPEGGGVAKTLPFQVNVLSAISKEDARPTEEVSLKPPERVTFPWFWAVLMGILSVLVLAAAFYFILKKLGKKTEAQSLVTQSLTPILPEDEEALKALQTVENAGWMQAGKYKVYYFRISEIFKSYIGRRYGFDAVESTTGELLRYLEKNKLLSPELMDQMDSLFQRMDRVKFTDYVPNFDESLHLLQDARMLVLNTKKPKTQPNDGVKDAI